MSDTSQAAELKLPYGSFQTFWGFIEVLGQKPRPPQIDRTMFNGKSGSDQVGIMMALRAFQLVDGEQNNVKLELDSLAAAPKDERKRMLQTLIRTVYGPQLEISDQNGTERMLSETFEPLTGETRRKAMTFFLHAAREAGISLSPNFPTTRSGPGASSGNSSRRVPKKRVAEVPPPRDPGSGAQDQGDRFTVELDAGGSVTLVVNVGHFALSRNKTDRDFVQKLMDALVEYEDAKAKSGVEEPFDVPGEDDSAED